MKTINQASKFSPNAIILDELAIFATARLGSPNATPSSLSSEYLFQKNFELTTFSVKIF